MALTKKASTGKKAATKKAATKKAATKKAAKKPPAKKAPATKKAATKKAATRKAATKPPTKNPVTKKAVAKPLPAAKKAAKKPAAAPTKTTAASKAAPRKAATGRHAPKPADQGRDPARLIDARIEELGDWRGKTLAQVRKLIHQADPQVAEAWKWRGVPVWEHDGILCTGETYKDYVKLTFAKGAALADPARLFNASLEGNARRAIDIRQNDTVDEAALKALIRDAVALNTAKPARRR